MFGSKCEGDAELEHVDLFASELFGSEGGGAFAFVVTWGYTHVDPNRAGKISNLQEVLRRCGQDE